MITSNLPISAISKIGPKYKKYLEKLDIYTVEDLLYHFPFRYEDFSVIKRIKDISEGETVTLRGILGPVENIFTRYRKRITKGKLIDYTGEINILWFNQHYLKSNLKTGASYTISGKVGISDRKLTIISPEIEEIKDSSLNTGRLVPVYSETEGISSKWLRARINDVLTNYITDPLFEEFLPEDLLSKYNFKNFVWCINQIHFPENSTLVEEAKKRFAFEELFMELLNVEYRKLDWSKKQKGKSFVLTEDAITQFIKTLPFKLSDSQIECINEIKKDLTIEKPMNRLLEGDVGSGKTVVAVVASYICYLNKLKTLYMAPTEILAEQHYNTFKTLFTDFPLKIGIVTGSKKIDNEEYNILIGTHALLFNKNTYQDIGLIIIDEQHRFGVEQRGKILEISKQEHTPNLLSMTATPIPRTLALTLYGDLDISVLETAPERKRIVHTKIVPTTKRMEAYKWINEKNVPTFIVCPLINESDSESLENVKAAQTEFEYLAKDVFKGKKIGLLHGKMKAEDKNNIVNDFKHGKIQVLVATPVIEVGIDIPDASVIVIESGERYGLASLHQLRGRVGRGGQEGFCFICMSNYSQNGFIRLKNLENVDDGKKLAEIDLKLRGQGDIFNTMQHGYKRFHFASLDNIELLENAKQNAEKYFTELDKHPKLSEKLYKKGKYVKSN
jgi:ATP-dependent DNA helicase RecG